ERSSIANRGLRAIFSFTGVTSSRSSDLRRLLPQAERFVESRPIYRQGGRSYSGDMRRAPFLAAATVAIALASAVAMTAALAEPAPWRPTRVFVQAGAAGHRTDQ